MADRIVWISGATDGVGSELAQTAPWPDARIITLNRRVHPEFETVQFDFARPEIYSAVEESFRKELNDFSGNRAIFFHNAFNPVPANFASFSKSIKRITRGTCRPMPPRRKSSATCSCGSWSRTMKPGWC